MKLIVSVQLLDIIRDRFEPQPQHKKDKSLVAITKIEIKLNNSMDEMQEYTNGRDFNQT
jgi:hypothetical protein